MQYRYCLTCGRICAVSLDENLREWHVGEISKIMHGNDVFDDCYGPFTNSTPPKDRPDWELVLDEPSAAEISLMNKNAALLLTDFEINHG